MEKQSLYKTSNDVTPNEQLVNRICRMRAREDNMPATPFKRALFRKRFTLIELLVVIAIIAILASMLLPALNKARESGKSAKCISNMTQVSTALVMYTGDWKGWLPHTLWHCEYSSRLVPYLGITPYYVLGEVAYFDEPQSVLHCPSSEFFIDKIPAVYGPSYAPTMKWPTASGRKNGCWIYLDGWNLTNPNQQLDKIVTGSAIMAEKNWTQNNDGRGEVDIFSGMYDLLNKESCSFVHNLGSNFLFQDGHVGSVKYLNGAKCLTDDYQSL